VRAAAARVCLKRVREEGLRSWLMWLWTEAWTEANFCSVRVSTALHADEQPSHYDPLPSETLAEAVENFVTYNRKLADKMYTGHLRLIRNCIRFWMKAFGEKTATMSKSTANDVAADASPDVLAASTTMLGAYERIKTGILHGTFPPGVRLSQVKIAERLGLSRTPVREALRLIEKEGLITSDRGRQIVISATSMMDLDELYALRIKLDTTTARTTVPGLTDADLDEMRSCLARMEANAAPDRFDAFDHAHRMFHIIVIRDAGPRHVEYSTQLNEHAGRYRKLYMVQANSYQQSRDEHQAILDACATRDGTAVACLLAEHYARIALTIIAQIEPQFEPRQVRSAVRIALQDRTGPTRKSLADGICGPHGARNAGRSGKESTG
jgi:DNA-binding GntR family transcriptional regulator